MVIVDDKLIPLLEEMLYELYENRLEVCLVPGTHEDADRMIRTTTSVNVDWYREICNTYPSTRKRKSQEFDTRIKRRNVILLLERMIKNKQSRSQYAADLLTVAEDRLELYERCKAEEEKNAIWNQPWDNQF